MRSAGCAAELLRCLAAMPFLDRLEAAAVSGWSRGAAYAAMARLEDRGLASSVPHASEVIPPTRRFYLTEKGLRQLSRDEGHAVDALLREHPVSAQGLRVLLERLDALAVIYRVAANVSNAAHPMRFRWYRAEPLDAALLLPGGRTLGIVREGRSAERTAFSKRLWRTAQGRLPGGLLVLVPDAVRLRRTRRSLRLLPLNAFLAVDREAARAGVDSRVWHPVHGGTRTSVRHVLQRLGRKRALPLEPQPSRAAPPEDVPTPLPGPGVPGRLLPVLLRPAEKRTLDLLADWPWIGLGGLWRLLGLSAARTRHLLLRVGRYGLAARVDAAGQTRWALTDAGLALLARRDRTSVGAARRRWSVGPQDPDAPRTWRNVTGTRSRQLLRHIEHTEAVHGFAAALARQARALGWTLVQIDPPHRASRFFRHDGVLHSVCPDAFGVLRGGSERLPFFLEWERRAVRPVTMTARLAPYLRYFSSKRPVDDHGALPAVLVVVVDDLTATHFLRVAWREMARAGVHVPLYVSCTTALDAAGPLGRAWRTPGGSEPVHIFREA